MQLLDATHGVYVDVRMPDDWSGWIDEIGHQSLVAVEMDAIACGAMRHSVDTTLWYNAVRSSAVGLQECACQPDTARAVGLFPVLVPLQLRHSWFA